MAAIFLTAPAIPVECAPAHAIQGGGGRTVARQPAPWRRGGKQGPWYAQVDGRQVRLVDGTATKDDAWKVLKARQAELKAGRRPAAATGGVSTGDVLRLYVLHTIRAVKKGELTAKCRDDYAFFLDSAIEAFGGRLLADLVPHHVTEWLDNNLPGTTRKDRRGRARKGWGTTSRNKAVGIVGQALAWAKAAGHTTVNPLAGMARAQPGRREEVLTPAQADAILATVTCPRFRDLIVALRETGCRPGEVYSLTADRVDLDGGTWRVTNKTRRKTGEKLRTVYLSDAALELSRRLVASCPSGPLFRNAWGGGWTIITVAKRFETLRAKLGHGPECVAYSFRHLYVTDCLERGTPPATVAELVGHTDLKMIMRVYSKLRHRTEHLREAARAVRK